MAGLVLVLSSTTQANRALLKDGDSDDYRFSTSQVGYKDWAGRCKEPELQWLRAYAEFHAGARKSKDAKYLVYSCSVNQHCGGLGELRRRAGHVCKLENLCTWLGRGCLGCASGVPASVGHMGLHDLCSLNLFVINPNPRLCRMHSSALASACPRHPAAAASAPSCAPAAHSRCTTAFLWDHQEASIMQIVVALGST